jgi:hypothetical protein
MDDLRRRRILYHLRTEQSPSGDAKQHTANPYFYLIRADPQPQWLTPAQTGYALAQRTPLAVALDTTTQTYKTCTRADAEAYGLIIHHFM